MQMNFQNDWIFRYMTKHILNRSSEKTLTKTKRKQSANLLNLPVVCADKEDRIKRIMELESLDREAAQKKVEDTDKERAAYYYENTGKTWGDVNDYHMILDTSELGVDNCANILMQYFERLEYI